MTINLNSESLTSGNQRDLLTRYATDKKCLVEVGVCFGGTSTILRAAMSPQGRLFLVDPFPADLNQSWRGAKLTPDLDRAKRNVETVKNGTVVWMVQTSQQASKNFADKADFVFIDGLHDKESVLLDWACWNPFVEEGGHVLFHDVTGPHAGVMAAWNELNKTKGWTCLGIREGIGIMRRGL